MCSGASLYTCMYCEKLLHNSFECSMYGDDDDDGDECALFLFHKANSPLRFTCISSLFLSFLFVVRSFFKLKLVCALFLRFAHRLYKDNVVLVRAFLTIVKTTNSTQKLYTFENYDVDLARFVLQK